VNDQHRAGADECKSRSTSHSTESSLSPAPSPSPCTMLSDLNIEQDAAAKYQQYSQDIAHKVKTYKYPRKSRKRKLHEDTTSTTTNCLRKVTLSDGSVCFTMAPTASPVPISKSTYYPSSEPPKKKQRQDAIARIQRSKTPRREDAAKVVLDHDLIGSPMRTPRASTDHTVISDHSNDSNDSHHSNGSNDTPTSMTSMTSTTSMTSNTSNTSMSSTNSADPADSTTTSSGWALPSTPKMLKKKTKRRRQPPNDAVKIKATAKRKEMKRAKKKPVLAHANTMPAPQPKVQKRTKAKLRRSRTEDWTSKANLLSSLRNQEQLKDQVFPSRSVPAVNLEEIFNGQQFIRVHKKIRPINLRRETQMFHVDHMV